MDKLDEIKKALKEAVDTFAVLELQQEYDQAVKAITLLTETQEQKAVELDALKADVMGAFFGAIPGKDEWGEKVTVGIIDYLASKNLLRVNEQEK